MTPHLMLDIETLGTSPQAPIIQLGLVAFNPENASPIQELAFNIAPRYGLYKVDHDTVLWWLQQGHEARTSLTQFVCQENKVLNDLDVFMYNYRNSPLWCHATFDIPCLANMYRVNHRRIPWNFRKVRDIRTIQELAEHRGYERQAPKEEEVPHTAIGDCHRQLRDVCAMLSII